MSIWVGVVLLFAASVSVRFLRLHLACLSLEDPSIAIWGGQVVFGYYFVLLVLAIRAFDKQLRSSDVNYEKLTLLFIAIGLAADIVLNDIQEASATKKLDASYGPVIIWDSLAFFAWMRAIDLCDGSDLSEFRRSFSVLTLPLWMLGREIIWSPFAGIKPYVDLVAEELTAGLWLPLLWVRSMQTPRAHVAGRLLVAFVLFGGAYAWISDLEDVAFLAYKPLDHLVSVRPYEKLGIPTYTENFIFVFLAALAVALVERWNPRGLGERLGLRAASLSETAPSPTSG